MKNTLLFFIICASATLHSQWYFETGINDAKFAEYTNLSGTKTTLHTYNGLRDVSFATGYVFPFKALDKRAEVDGRSAILRLGVGVGFDQMNLRTMADIGNSQIPVEYNMAQVQGQLNAIFTPTIISKKEPDAFGIRRSVVNLLLEGGLTYNFYTNAVRSYTSGKSFIQDLRNDDDEFVVSYPAFSFGGGFEFPLSNHTEIYAKYVVENPFDSAQDGKNSNGDEKYTAVKRRVMVGLRLDLRLKNKLIYAQEQRIAALEARDESARQAVDLKPLHDRIDVLQELLDTHGHDEFNSMDDLLQNEDAPVIVGRLFDVKTHERGFMYLPDFKHILFPFGSSYFDYGIYKNQLIDLASFLKQNKHLKLKLVGYADSRTGTKAGNLILSERRAKRVYDYLLSKGVPKDQMSSVGAGETLQFNLSELTENRRTEIIILEQ